MFDPPDCRCRDSIGTLLVIVVCTFTGRAWYSSPLAACVGPITQHAANRQAVPCCQEYEDTGQLVSVMAPSLPLPPGIFSHFLRHRCAASYIHACIKRILYALLQRIWLLVIADRWRNENLNLEPHTPDSDTLNTEPPEWALHSYY